VHTGIIAFMALALSAATAQAQYTSKVAAAGKPMELYWAASVNPDCSANGTPTIKIAEAPSHGRVTINRTGVFATFSAANVRQRCNTRRVAGVKAFYISQRGYRGPDRVAFEVIWPSGRYVRRDVSITVR
jgi:hypothetical protein